MIESIRREWTLQHQAGAQYFAVECKRGSVAMHTIEASAPQVVPTKRLITETFVMSFLRRNFRCRRKVRDLFNVTPTYFGFALKDGGLPFRSKFKILTSLWCVVETV